VKLGNLSGFSPESSQLSLIQRNGQEGKRILARMSSIEDSMIAVTVITYEEQVRGRLNLVSQAKTLDDRVRAYSGSQVFSTRPKSQNPFHEGLQRA
jgi:tRNA(fMet)-specific endonuclease VapC